MKKEIITIENGIISVPTSTQIWMTQHEIAGLFECFVAKVNANIRSILKSRVLDETKVCRTYRYSNGNSVEKYNLEMITALSFRIKSRNTDVFREWIVKKVTTNTSVKQIFICSHCEQNGMLN